MKNIFSIIALLLFVSTNGQITKKEYYQSFLDLELKNHSPKIHTLITTDDMYTKGTKPVKSDCGAKFEEKSNSFTLLNKYHCDANFWLEDLTEISKPRPFTFMFNFTLDDDFVAQEKKWPLQILLATSPSKTIFLGVDVNGKFYLSYNNGEEYVDLVTVSKADKVHMDKENTIQFTWFPEGYYYYKLNSFEQWSFELPEDKQKIPFTGLSNRISYTSNVDINLLALLSYTNRFEPIFYEDVDVLKEVTEYSVQEDSDDYLLKKYYKDGTLSAIALKSDNKLTIESYYENGEKNESVELIDGKGSRYIYNEMGFIIKVIDYENFEPVGER
ncbi:MAG TPA: hypothetical protein EYO35_05930 [Flavobacteriaceae bacterium]|nr:hypothetical protein [Flavobacteriaceae bacterium]